MENNAAAAETIAKFEDGIGVFFPLDVEPLISEITLLMESMEAYGGDWLHCTNCGHWHPVGNICVFCGRDASDDMAG